MMFFFLFFVVFFVFFFKQKTAYEILAWLEFRRVLFRSYSKFFLQSQILNPIKPRQPYNIVLVRKAARFEKKITFEDAENIQSFEDVSILLIGTLSNKDGKADSKEQQ